MLPPCVLRRESSEREGGVCSYPAPSLHTSNTPWFYGCKRTQPSHYTSNVGILKTALSPSQTSKISGTTPGHRPDWLHHVSFCHLARGRMAHRSHATHSVIQSSLIPGGKNVKERKTCGVLYGREPNVHRSLSREGFRRDEARDCSLQTQEENTPKHNVSV